MSALSTQSGIVNIGSIQIKSENNWQYSHKNFFLKSTPGAGFGKDSPVLLGRQHGLIHRTNSVTVLAQTLWRVLLRNTIAVVRHSIGMR